MKAGDKVVCINDDHLKDLTVGQVYLVKQVEEDDIWTFNDKNQLQRLPAKLFESSERGVIVVTDQNGVKSIRSCTKPNCEAKLLDACKENVSNWDEHTDEEKDDILIDGLYETKGGTIIAVIWLDEDGNYN